MCVLLFHTTSYGHPFGHRLVTGAPASPVELWVHRISNALFCYQDFEESDSLETMTVRAEGDINGIAIFSTGKSYGLDQNG